MSSFQLHDNDANETINLNAPMRNFQFPPSSGTGLNLGLDMIANKSKLSGDTASLVSGSYQSSDSESDTNSIHHQPSPPQKNIYNMSSSSSSDDETEEDIIADGPFGPDHNVTSSRIQAEKAQMETELNEKREILYQLDRLVTKGFNIPRKFTIQNSLDEMKTEYHRIIREKEVDASVRFQRKMLVGLVTGVEYLNTKFDPFDLKLDGFSENIHENVGDYDDIFEELHEKYKSTGRKMAPELRLMMGLSGSAFQFHLTKSMFKANPLPQTEAVLRSNPELMKQFQAQATRMAIDPNAALSGAPMGGGNNPGIFGMLGNMFGLNNTTPQMHPNGKRPPMSMPQQSQQSQQSQQKMSDPGDIENIINQIQGEISTAPNNSRFETMTVSDEDITSIIEDEIGGILSKNRPKATARRGRPPTNNKSRTLNI